MKRLLAIITCAVLLMLSIPGPVQAAGPKEDLINNYVNTMSQSAQFNKSMYEGIKSNTVNFTFKGTLEDLVIIEKDGTTISNIPGHFNLTAAFDLAAQKGSCQIDAYINGKDIKGQIYLYNRWLIMTNGLQYSLNDRDDYYFYEEMPEYTVQQIPAEDWQNMFNSLDQSINSGSQQTETVIALVKEILNLFPDSCYSYVDGKPALKLTLSTLTSNEFLNGIKADSSVMADKIYLLLGPPQEVDSGTYKVTKQNIIEGINQIDPGKVQKAMKACPITLMDFTVTAYAGGLDQSFDFEIRDNSGTLGAALKSHGQINSSKASSDAVGTITIKADQDDFKVGLDANSSMDQNEMNQNYDLTLKGTINESRVDGKGNITLNINWNTKNTIDIPDLTEKNSNISDYFDTNYASDSDDEDWDDYEPYRDSDTIYVEIDDDDFNFGSNQPIIVDGHVMVPLRDLAVYMGCKVEWQPGASIKIINDNETVTLDLNSRKYSVGVMQKELDGDPIMINGHTYVPLTFFADYFDYDIEWDGELNTVFLYSY